MDSIKEMIDDRQSKIKELNKNYSLGGETGFSNVVVNRDKLDQILSSQFNLLNYEEDLFTFERNLNVEISKNRTYLLK